MILLMKNGKLYHIHYPCGSHSLVLVKNSNLMGGKLDQMGCGMHIFLVPLASEFRSSLLAYLYNYCMSIQLGAKPWVFVYSFRLSLLFPHLWITTNTLSPHIVTPLFHPLSLYIIKLHHLSHYVMTSAPTRCLSPTATRRSPSPVLMKRSRSPVPMKRSHSLASMKRSSSPVQMKPSCSPAPMKHSRLPCPMKLSRLPSPTKRR